MTFHIRPTDAADWRAVRDLRLEMLRDTPIAFGETIATAESLGEAEWRMRGARGTDGHGTAVAAIDDDSGRWLGTMGGYLDKGMPLLVGVYVTPEFRGRDAGVASALLETIETWAREHGDTLMLHVHEENVRARAFYASRGFAETGKTHPYVLDRSSRELELVKSVAG